MQSRLIGDFVHTLAISVGQLGGNQSIDACCDGKVGFGIMDRREPAPPGSLGTIANFNISAHQPGQPISS